MLEILPNRLSQTLGWAALNETVLNARIHSNRIIQSRKKFSFSLIKEKKRVVGIKKKVADSIGTELEKKSELWLY